MPLSTGARLGPYEILSAVGAGGTGEVYKARDARLLPTGHLWTGAAAPPGARRETSFSS